MDKQKTETGKSGEQEAAEFITKRGYAVLDRNYRMKNIGEIDIVAEKDRKITFFEVKTRSVKHETIFPIEFSINEKKRRNLKKICQIYLNEKGFPDRDWQVDALFVKVGEDETYTIQHLANILWESYY